MINEVLHIKQVKGEPKRRLFSDKFFDLYVWSNESCQIVGFQLCYDKERNCRALTWWQNTGYSHNRVDDGENRPGKYKATPVLVPDGTFDKKTIFRSFLKACSGMEQIVLQFVLKKISGY